MFFSSSSLQICDPRRWGFICFIYFYSHAHPVTGTNAHFMLQTLNALNLSMGVTCILPIDELFMGPVIFFPLCLVSPKLRIIGLWKPSMRRFMRRHNWRAGWIHCLDYWVPIKLNKQMWNFHKATRLGTSGWACLSENWVTTAPWYSTGGNPGYLSICDCSSMPSCSLLWVE